MKPFKPHSFFWWILHIGPDWSMKHGRLKGFVDGLKIMLIFFILFYFTMKLTEKPPKTVTVVDPAVMQAATKMEGMAMNQMRWSTETFYEAFYGEESR